MGAADPDRSRHHRRPPRALSGGRIPPLTMHAKGGRDAALRGEGGRPVISRSLPSAEREAVVRAGLLGGASTALLLTSLIGGTALLLELVWPWLAWGYVGAALVLGLALQWTTVRIRRALEREVERVRQEHRSG